MRAQTKVECIGSIVSVYLQCRLQIHCTYSCRCSAQKCFHERPFYSVFAVNTAECSAPAVYLQCSSSVLAVYMQSRKLNQGVGTVYTAVCSVYAVYHFLYDKVTTVYMQCIYSVGTVYTAVCSVSAVYEQPILQVHCVCCSGSVVYTAWHCRYTPLRSGRCLQSVSQPCGGLDHRDHHRAGTPIDCSCLICSGIQEARKYISNYLGGSEVNQQLFRRLGNEYIQEARKMNQQLFRRLGSELVK